MEIFLVLLTALCVTVVMKIVDFSFKRHQFTSIIDKIPGPKSYPVLGNALSVMSVSRKDMYSWMQIFFGSFKEGIFRIWMGFVPTIHLTAPETIREVLSSQNLINKSIIYHSLRPWLGRGLITSTGSTWHQQRKFIAPTFNFNTLEQFAMVMAEKAEILKKCVTSELEKDPKKPIDMFVLLTRCTLDVICEAAMGININAQTEYDTDYTVALHSITVEAVERMLRPWLYQDWIYYRTRRGQRFKKHVETAHKLTTKVIRERRLAREMQTQNVDQDIHVEKSNRQAFLDHLLNACERENSQLTDEMLREQVDTFMFAGHDTSAAAMSWMLFCIGNHPEVEEKIHEEQLRVFGDSTESPTIRQISELRYLERVIKETLRLFPSVPVISRVLTDDVTIAGFKIPKNVIVCLHFYKVHRDPRYWSDPDKFDPDRFLPENSQGRHPNAYVPFSAGPRNCVGQKFAMMEMKIILTALLRTWRIRSLLKFHEAKCLYEFMLRPQDGMMIHFTRK